LLFEFLLLAFRAIANGLLFFQRNGMLAKGRSFAQAVERIGSLWRARTPLA